MSPTHSQSLGAYGEQVLGILGTTPRNNIETVRDLLQGFAGSVHTDFEHWDRFPALSHVFQRLAELKEKARQADFSSWLTQFTGRHEAGAFRTWMSGMDSTTWNDRANALHAEAADHTLAALHRLRPRRTSSTHSDSASSSSSGPPSPSVFSPSAPPPPSGRSPSPIAREPAQRPSVLGSWPRGYAQRRPTYSMSYVPGRP